MARHPKKNEHYNLKKFAEGDIVMLVGKNERYGNYPVIFKALEFRPRQKQASRGVITIVDSVIDGSYTINHRLNVLTDYLYVLKPTLSLDEYFCSFKWDGRRITYDLDNTLENTFVGKDEIKRGLSQAALKNDKLALFSNNFQTFLKIIDPEIF